MLSRYTIYRRRPVGAAPLPGSIRQDTRHRTRHVLRPTKDMVENYLASPTDAAWRKFKKAYLALLNERFREDRTPFDELAAIVAEKDVHLGCSCPTKRNPVVGRCHTYLALEFMKKKYPAVEIAKQ